MLELSETYLTGATLVYVASVLLSLLAYTAGYNVFAPPKESSVKSLGGFSFINAWTFFTKRYDFILHNFAKTSALHFKFNVLHVSIHHTPFLEIPIRPVSIF